MNKLSPRQKRRADRGAGASVHRGGSGIKLGQAGMSMPVTLENFAQLPESELRAAAIGLASRADEAVFAMFNRFSDGDFCVEGSVFVFLHMSARRDEIFDYLLQKSPTADRWWNFVRDCGAFSAEACDQLGLRPIMPFDQQPIALQLVFRAVCATAPMFYRSISLAQIMAKNEAKGPPARSSRPATGPLLREQVTGMHDRSFANEKVGDDD